MVLTHKQHFGILGTEQSKFLSFNTTAVIVQAEHIQAVENIREIAGGEGVDAVLVGPYDLTASMDRLGQVSHPEVMAAIDKVTRPCLELGVRLSIFQMTAKAAAEYAGKGYTALTVGVDAVSLGQAASHTVQQVKQL